MKRILFLCVANSARSQIQQNLHGIHDSIHSEP
jgi:protein-tyrosine-phosphatase